MNSYDPEQAGWSDGYFDKEPQPPAYFSDEYFHGYANGQLDRLEKEEWINGLAVDMALVDDQKRRAS